jgi:hypothetical protein
VLNIWLWGTSTFSSYLSRHSHSLDHLRALEHTHTAKTYATIRGYNAERRLMFTAHQYCDNPRCDQAWFYIETRTLCRRGSTVDRTIRLPSNATVVERFSNHRGPGRRNNLDLRGLCLSISLDILNISHVSNPCVFTRLEPRRECIDRARCQTFFLTTRRPPPPTCGSGIGFRHPLAGMLLWCNRPSHRLFCAGANLVRQRNLGTCWRQC